MHMWLATVPILKIPASIYHVYILHITRKENLYIALTGLMSAVCWPMSVAAKVPDTKKPRTYGK